MHWKRKNGIRYITDDLEFLLVILINKFVTKKIEKE